MAQINKLCLGCMCEKNTEGACEQCGYREDTPYLPSYLAPGTVLNDRYITGKLLSYNGEGATYIGYDKATDTRVTIKEYMPDTLCSRKKGDANIIVEQNQMPLYKTYMSEFIELNKALMKSRTLTHIQTVLDIFPENNTAYVIFEYVNGISLKSYLSNCSGELTWDRVKELFPPILTTLGLVHNAGIIHRGISPQTILVTEKNELKLIDFQISAGRTNNTEIACEMYSGFAAPEQYSSAEWQGAWTDVYGIAAVLYRALTGCAPVEAVSRMGNDTCPEPMAINRNVPSHVSKVLMNGLKLNTEARIQSINELVTKLFEQPKFNTAETEAIRPAVAVKRTEPSYEKFVAEPKKAKKKEGASTTAIIITIIICVAVVTAFSIAIGIFASSDFGTNSSDPNYYSVPETSEPTSIDIQTLPPLTDETSSGVNSVAPNDTTYMVPNFVGRIFTSIQENQSYSFLKITATYKFDDNVAAGLIIKQDVDPDTEVKSGKEIELIVSKGPAKVALPDYKDMTVEQYTGLLSQKNIKFTTVPQPTSEHEVNMVIKCNKKVGDKINVEKSEKVTVYYAVKDNSDTSSGSSTSSKPAESNTSKPSESTSEEE